MLDLDELSRIGFGSYRISERSPEHYQALMHALALGCNLVDTASNYMDGESELVIGRVLRDNSSLTPFIITKGGYIHSEVQRGDIDLARISSDPNAVTELSEETFHSITPDVLNVLIEQSCARLGRDSLDAFLLHNPEHYFDRPSSGKSQEDYYARIQRAFAFLEEQVSVGKLRYFGISSNTLPLSTGRHDTTNLRRVLVEARAASGASHCKLIEFPFNMIERSALQDHHDGTNLLALANDNGLTTLGNRPLNAQAPGGMLRLATYEDQLDDLNPGRDRAIFEECLAIVRRRLDDLGIPDNVLEFAVIGYLDENWMQITSPEVATMIFRRDLFPFLDHLFEGVIPPKSLKVFQRLHDTAVLYSRRSMTQVAWAARERLVQAGSIASHDERSLAVIACEDVLTAGIKHVLVGMRRVQYVDSLKLLLSAGAESSPSAVEGVGK